jgi:chemotaxis protein MotB
MDSTPIIIKKRKAHAHAHHGGSWKVAYADFVTAMMAFFMVMWIMGLSDETKAQIQGYFNDPIGFTKNQPKSKTVVAPKTTPSMKPNPAKWQPGAAGETDRKSMAQLKSDLEKLIAASPELSKLLEHIDFQITDDGLRIEFIDNKEDFFESGQAVLKPGAVKVLKALAPKLATSGRPMVVEGHTDSAPFGDNPFGNFKLSTDRAAAVQMALGQFGVGAKRFKYVKGLADTELRDPRHPMSAVNRRVSLLLKFVTSPVSTVPMPKDAVREGMKGAIIPEISTAPRIPNLAASARR